MDREGFRNRLKQYKKTREENPGLKYWEWKSLPKYDEGTTFARDFSTEENPIYYKEETAKEKYIRAYNALLKAGGWSNRRRDEIADTYTIPYIPEKEIRLTAGRYNTGKISTNLLDSIHASAIRTGVPVDIALGLAGRESTLGIGRGFKEGLPVSGTNLMSNWLQVGYIVPEKNRIARYNDIRKKIASRQPVSDEEYSYAADYMFDDIYKGNQMKRLTENPIDNALRYYLSGKYNPGDKRHALMVEEDARILMSDPAILKWAKEKGIKYAEGGEVTGPPTYEDWYADVTKYNPTIWDNYSMQVSLDAAKKALHNEAMELPGYAPMWNEYIRTLPKAEPSINEFVDDLWVNENPNNTGYRRGRYYPHKSPEGGTMTIGPGFKLGSGSHNISDREAYSGMTKSRLNQEARKIGKKHLNAVNQFLNQGQTTNPADTVSPQIKMGLMDLRHLVGPLGEWKNLRDAVLTGDIDKIKKESTVTWDDNGVTRVDKRRKNIRDTKYFYY